MTFKTLHAAALLALLASPALAASVPLNTLNGNGGTAQVDGQGEALLSGGLAAGGVAIAIVVAVVAVAASSDSSSSTPP